MIESTPRCFIMPAASYTVVFRRQLSGFVDIKSRIRSPVMNVSLTLSWPSFSQYNGQPRATIHLEFEGGWPGDTHNMFGFIDSRKGG